VQREEVGTSGGGNDEIKKGGSRPSEGEIETYDTGDLMGKGKRDKNNRGGKRSPGRQAYAIENK